MDVVELSGVRANMGSAVMINIQTKVKIVFRCIKISLLIEDNHY